MRKLNWKKIVAGTLSAIMLLSVTACGSSSTKSESASTEASKKELTIPAIKLIKNAPSAVDGSSKF